jgi:hypothetical protein
MNPVGFCLPPATIFSRKRMKPELFKGASEGTVPTIQDGGFINKELFIEWLGISHTDFCLVFWNAYEKVANMKI